MSRSKAELSVTERLIIQLVISLCFWSCQPNRARFNQSAHQMFACIQERARHKARQTCRCRIKEIETRQEPQTHSRHACQRGFQEPNIKNYECAIYDPIKIYKTIWTIINNFAIFLERLLIFFKIYMLYNSYQE